MLRRTKEDQEEEESRDKIQAWLGKVGSSPKVIALPFAS